jgi:hypothetical protein
LSRKSVWVEHEIVLGEARKSFWVGHDFSRAVQSQ